MNDHIFKCEEDLEAVILHENTDAFAAIINKDLYGVTGKPPDQNIYFHSDSCFDLFCIHVFELLAGSAVELSGRPCQLSLFTGARWLVERHKDAWESSKFIDAYESLDSWLKEKPRFSFWCGDISKQIEFSLSRRKILRFAQLLSKHNLFRLTGVLDELHRICNKTGHDIKESEVLPLLEPFREELKTNRVIYHSSYLIEMLHDYFTALNDFAILFYTPSPRISDWKYLENMSSDTFKDLFYRAISFASGYNRNHYDSLRPATTRHLKGLF
ncbi:hypothetical protein MELA_01621 [Candidatus Methylomirabilis lanthanidiphila]|uniref:Uncharacterized protein n=1 Tax=Candidatus Methylomirabilis lanthanidiphila TaxID=2211376 RepID=A0A564ZIS9_9BACT|nr:hypothetical protein [Candidatus Methylomirabilis lanthanidiphila]VUZ85239.1 hypothetical protein MELA_01621 [Candidatus Methylomirabilis lanthanidiphila]